MSKSEWGTANSERAGQSSRVRDFRDLIAWQKAIDTAEFVYQLTSNFTTDERFGLTSQLRRAAVSVASNIAEGHGRGPGKAFVNHLWIANGSLRELQTQAILASRFRYITQADCERVVSMCEEICRVLVGLRRAVS